MCHFITATLSADAKLEKVAALAKKHNLNWIQTENLSVQKQLENGSHYFYTTKGQCDCGTLLGSANNSNKDSKKDTTSQILALKKKGWSANKIERWLSEKTKLEEKREARKYTGIRASEIDSWINFISAVLNNNLASKFGLLLHMYSGCVATDVIALSGKVVTQLKNAREEVFLCILEDHLYEFVIT
jgi:predicted aminopeptidase